MPRIVSLLPAATDIVAALGRAHDLVGVTWECTIPPGSPARVVTRNLLDAAHDDVAAIDRAVQAAAETQSALAAVDEDAVAGLAPEVVLTQDLCRVCALPADAAQEAVERLGCDDATVIRLDPMTLADVLACITTVGDAIGAEEEAADLRTELEDRLDAVAARTSGRRPRPTAVVVEWIEPLFVGGHWIPDMVAAAGATNALGTPGGRSQPLDWSALPEVDHLVVAPCGFDLDGAVRQAEAIADRVPATTAVWAVDADALVVRPGPRVVEGVEVLAAAFAGGPDERAAGRPGPCGPERLRRIR